MHTPNFPELLRRLGASLLVTTYQAGKLVMVRDEGDHLNTHFRAFQAPMGLALERDRLAIGTSVQIWEFVDVPAVTAKLEPAWPPRCLLPAALVPHHGQRADPRDGLGQRRGALVRQHSLLVSLHARPLGQLHAAVAAAVCDGPRADRPLPLERRGDGRRPPAVCDGPGPDRLTRRLAAGEGERRDRDGRRKRRGARAAVFRCRTRRGGTPGALWVCESGVGTLGFLDPQTGRYEAVAATPGFTRGLDFAGDLAFVGLSQVRESAVFSGIPITERLDGPRANLRRLRDRPGARRGRSRSCGLKRAFRRSSPCRCSPAAATPS